MTAGRGTASLRHRFLDSAVPGLLRHLELPAEIPGLLYLTAMPGRFAPLAEFTAAAQAAGIGRVLCLTGMAEIAAKSRDYAAALAADTLPMPVSQHAIEDFGVPSDTAGFAAWLRQGADALRGGQGVVLHCAAGIGRTGTAALCLLHLLGVPGAEARVAAAGSHPETDAQRAFVRRFRADQSPG